MVIVVVAVAFKSFVILNESVVMLLKGDGEVAVLLSGELSLKC